MTRRAALSLLLAAALAACGSNAAPADRQAPAAADAVGGSRRPVRPYPQAAEVRLFTAETGELMEPIFDPKFLKLTDAQRRAYEQLLYVQTGGDLSVAGCFEPHHFFRYYDGKGKQVGEVAVCFCCGGVESDPNFLHLRDDQLFKFDHARLRALITSWGVRTDIGCPPPLEERS
jgi:hypothetical protein